MHHGEDESTSYAFGMFGLIVENQTSFSMYILFGICMLK